MNFSRCVCIRDIFLRHYKHRICVFLVVLLSPCAISPKSFPKAICQYLGCCRIIHQFFVTQNCLPGDGVNHEIGIVFKVHRNFCLFHQLCWYVYPIEQGLLFQSEYIDCMPRDIVLSCSAWDGCAGRCLLVLRLDSCWHSSPLACAWGRLHHEWMRAIE